MDTLTTTDYLMTGFLATVVHKFPFKMPQYTYKHSLEWVNGMGRVTSLGKYFILLTAFPHFIRRMKRLLWFPCVRPCVSPLII